MANTNVLKEQEVISIMLNDEKCREEGILELSVRDFTDSDCRTTFARMYGMYNSDIPISEITMADIAQYFSADDKKSGYDSFVVLAKLSAISEATFDFSRNVRILKKLTALRGISSILSERLIDINNGEISALDDIKEAIENVDFEFKEDSRFYLADYLPDIVNKIGAPQSKGRSTGFPELDKLSGGLVKGNLVVVAGRPGMGKSAFATNIGSYVAKHGGIVAHFSLEMSVNEVGWRILSGETETQESDYDMNSPNYYKATEKNLAALDIFMDTDNYKYCLFDKKSTLADILRTCKKVKHRAKGLDLVIIDYIGIIQSANASKNMSRQQILGEITHRLKRFALEEECTVLAVAQLNRESEKRNNHEPILSDLRESGDIEQDADIVMFPFRESMFDESVPETEAKVIIPKNRNGQTGYIRLNWFGQWTKFKNPATADQMNYARSRGYEPDQDKE